MPRVGFEQAKTVHALDRAATVIAHRQVYFVQTGTEVRIMEEDDSGLIILRRYQYPDHIAPNGMMIHK
jgi:hypothetical protein